MSKLKLAESFENLSTLPTHRVGTGGDASISTGWRAWWTEAAGLRQRHSTACPVFGADCFSLNISLGFPCSRKKHFARFHRFPMFEKRFNIWFGWAWSLLWKQELAIHTMNVQGSHPGRVCCTLWPLSPYWIWLRKKGWPNESDQKAWKNDENLNDYSSWVSMSACRNQRMSEPMSDFTKDSTQITLGLLEFTETTIFICKHVRVSRHCLWTK